MTFVTLDGHTLVALAGRTISAMTIRIHVDGKLALTTSQAAERYGLTLATMRKALERLDIEVADHLDARTPLYLAATLDAAMRARPGKGANLRQTKDQVEA